MPGSLSTLTFPKSKSSLWDPSPAGDAVGLHLCYYRNPHLRILEKTLRLAHRHAHQRNNPTFCCFLLGSISVDEDEEGVTLTLDRFDPGRDQPGGRAPSLLLPGDVAVPVEFFLHGDEDPSSLGRPSDLTATFKALQRACSGAEMMDLSQLLGVRGQVSCSQQGDQLGFSMRWLAASCASCFDVVGVRPLPIIPTALARSLSGLSSPGPLSPSLKLQRGFLTMDHTRKILLLLESDPKACSVPLVGVWLSGVVQPMNPQVWAWCLRFFHSASLHDRVLSEQGWFLLVVFSAVPSQARFYQCRSAGKPSGHMDYLLLSCSQNISLFKHVEPAEGHYLQGDFSVDETTHTDLPRGPTPSSSRLLVATVDQDSGVEDGDLSPRPSPSPHAPSQQTRRVRPSVPELSLLVDASLPPSFPSDPPPAPQACTSSSSSRGGRPHLPEHLHSTPTVPLSWPRKGFWDDRTPPTVILPRQSPRLTPTPPGPSGSHPAVLQPGTLQPRALPTAALPTAALPTAALPTAALQTGTPQTRTPQTAAPPTAAPPTAAPQTGTLQTCPSPPLPCSCVRPGLPSWGEGWAGAPPSDAYQILMAQEHQLRLLQAQIQMLLDTQVRPQASGQTDGLTPCRPEDGPLCLSATRPPATASVAVETGASLFWGSTLGPPLMLGRHREDQPSPSTNTSTQELRGASGDENAVLGKSSSMLFNTSATQPDHQHVLPTLQLQVSSRLQASLSDQQTPSSSSSSSSSCCDRAHSYRKQEVSEGDEEQLVVNLDPRPNLATDQEASILDCINPALLPSPAQTPRDLVRPGDLSPAQTPRDLLRPGDLSPAQTPRDLLRPGDLSPAQTPRDLLRPGVLSQAQTPGDPLRPGRSIDLSLDQTFRNPLRPGGYIDLSLDQTPRDPLRPGGSVDLSLEANAIALRYLSDGQLSRLSAGGRRGEAALGSPQRSVPNMSLATRGYMRRYGLMEEEQEQEEEEDEEEVGLPCSILRADSSLPQSQLIRDLQPKLLLLAQSSRNQDQDKENEPVQRASLAAGSVGNFLDVSRLRQLPKLF